MSQTIQEERKEVVKSLLEQVEKLKKYEEFKEKIRSVSDVLLDLHYYYQKYKPSFYMYIYSSLGEKPTVCIVARYSFAEVKCYDERDVQKIIEMFFSDPSAETRLWKILKDVFSDFVTFVEDLIRHEDHDDP